jgi:G3E family GTPase
MKSALLEIKEKQNPDRIIIETSGSAFPAPIAWQIRELKDENFTLDSIITVVDTLNFKGYEDTSYTAKMQAQYTDLILLNKHELCSERELEFVIDHINDLNTDTPKFKWSPSTLTCDMIFGIDTNLFELSSKGNFGLVDDHHNSEIDLINIMCLDYIADIEAVTHFLDTLSKEYVYRVKGIIPSGDKTMILNWAFGRYTLTPLTKSIASQLELTVMGIELECYVSKFQSAFSAATLTYISRHK